jgi:hypothetical protein
MSDDLPTAPGWARYGTVAGVALLEAAVGLRVAAGRFTWDTDAPKYLYVARRILEGAVPYRDAWDQKPPGLHHLYAVILWGLGGPPLGLRGRQAPAGGRDTPAPLARREPAARPGNGDHCRRAVCPVLE